MTTSTAVLGSTPGFLPHQLRFTSLFHPGRAVVVPCDEAGQVNMDALSDRMRDVYLAARAMMGRDYTYPTLELHH